jgi:hypothetical protein
MITSCWSVYTEPPQLRVNILGTAFYNTKLVYILIKELKFKIVLKLEKEGVFVLLNAVYIHPVTKMYQLQWTRGLRPAWHTTNIFVLTYDPRQCQRAEHISGITCSSLWALAVFALLCRRDHANSSYQSMCSTNKYRVTEKGCVSLTARSSINQAVRPAWRL